MKIRFKHKRLRAHLLIGLVWIAFGMVSLVTNDTARWTDYGYMAVGLLYLGHYGVDRTCQYLTIENGTLRKNGLYGFGGGIALQDVVWIKKFAGDYTLITEQRQLKIDSDLIEENSLAELNQVLGALDLPPEKTPFAALAGRP